MTLIQLFFSFKGRVGRQTYWLFTLAMCVIALAPAFFIFGIDNDAADVYVNVVMLVFLWPALAVQAKRWHDRDKSAWWLLINLLPIIGLVWALVENGFLVGTPDANRFGPNPVQQGK